MSDHWLDRLSVRLTRRQAMKAGLAGAMIGGLPLAHPPAAGATTGSASLPCFKGCVWTAGNDFQNSFRGCAANFVVGHTSYLIGPAYGLFASASAFACKDLAIMRQKASFYDCVQPDCGGFNPKARGGPCDDCHNNCCPCGASDNGYICCVFDCNDPSNSCCPGGAGE